MSLNFAYDRPRASQAALWLMRRHGGTIDRLKLIKLIFLADRLHLASYGRPIVGGRYVAMEHGPVPSDFYDDIKSGSLPGTATSGPYKVTATIELDEDELSESDLDVLKSVNRCYGNMDSFRLRDLTHEFVAWSKNYRGNNSSYQLPYEDFFEDLTQEQKDILGLIEDAQEAERALG